MEPKNIAKSVLIGIGLLLVLIFWPFRIVSSGEKGLVFVNGAVQQKVLEPGLHLRLPIVREIKKITIRPIQLDYKVAVNADGAITKDNQTIGSDVSIFYTYDEGKLVEMWTRYGESKINALTASAVKESFKEVVGEYTIFDVATKQEKIRGDVTARVRAKMSAYPVGINELRVSNYDWSDAFDQQIQATMASAQQVKKAEQDLLLAEQQAQKQVKEAEAAKSALIAKAEGEKEAARLQAEAKALEGDGIRKYNEAVRSNIDIEIRLRELEIERLKADKWNGAYVPNNNYLPIPFNYGTVQGK